MPRYYFDLVSDGHIVQDMSGNDLPDLAAAEREAVEVAADLAGDELSECKWLVIQVRNRKSEPVLIVTFSIDGTRTAALIRTLN